jgi:hypothetical protein
MPRFSQGTLVYIVAMTSYVNETPRNVKLLSEMFNSVNVFEANWSLLQTCQQIIPESQVSLNFSTSPGEWQTLGENLIDNN